MTFASEAGHWYTQDGEPAYEVLGKNGKLRPTTVRDARKLNLAPSVTTIIRCAAAPGLEKWKRDNPDWETISGDARDLGTQIHGCIETCFRDQHYDPQAPHYDAVSGAFDALDGWCGSDVLPEKSFCHPIGYGGKCDVHKPGFVADFKSKDFTEDKLPLTYENHSMQLAAYREGFGMPTARCAIIYVSTAVPGLTHLVEICQADLDCGWEMFRALLTYWQWKNQHFPIEELLATGT